MYAELIPYLKLMRPFCCILLGGLLFNLLALVSNVSLIALSGWFFSTSAIAGLSWPTAQVFNFLLPSACVRFFAISRTVCRYGERLVTHQATLKLLAALRHKLYINIYISPLSRFGSCELMTRITADIDLLNNLYVRVLIPSFIALFWFSALTCLTCCYLPLLGPWLAWKRGLALALAHSSLLHQLDELELHGHGRWQDLTAGLLSDQQRLDNEKLLLARQWGNAKLIYQLLLGFTLTVILLPAAWWVQHKTLDATLVALMGLTVLSTFEVLAMLPHAWQNLGRIQRVALLLNNLIEIVPEIKFHNLNHPSDNRLVLSHLEVALDGTAVLHGINIDIAPGEHHALLGPSGGGKTTLLNALVRFVEPHAGRITIGGVDALTLSEQSMRANFAVAQQDVQLFSASYRDNLQLAGHEISDEYLVEVLCSLELGDWLDDQPNGIDTWPGESGSTLSGGQLRRLGIARALLSPATIVLIDEPTEELDSNMHAKVLKEIKRCCAGRTLIVITHRLHGLETFDRLTILYA